MPGFCSLLCITGKKAFPLITLLLSETKIHEKDTPTTETLMKCSPRIPFGIGCYSLNMNIAKGLWKISSHSCVKLTNDDEAATCYCARDE